MAETDQGSFYRKTLQFESHPVRQLVDMSHLPSVHIPPDSAEYLMPICNQGLCNSHTKSGRHSCYQNNHILQPLKNDCESRAQIYKNSMMISGTTIVWYGTQDSTIMDGKPTSELDIISYKREIDDMLSTVIAPAEYCAESKSQRAEGQQGSVFIMRDAAPNFVNSQNMHNFELIFQNVFLAMEYLSKQRYDEIQTELNGLINEVYPKVRENLAETASQGDRSDNAGYREAKRWNLLISTQMSR